MNINHLTHTCQIPNIVLEVIQQLRSQYDIDTLSKQIELQQKFGYQVVYAQSENEVLGVAGFVMGYKLAWGKHIYIDDLITNQRFRSKGVGKSLLDWIISYAKENQCQQIHLDSGVQRFSAHKFYLRENFNIASHHFALSLTY